MSTDRSLDDIIEEIGGLGKYQIFVIVLVSVGVIFHSCVNIAYVFTAKDIDYRCKIKECDSKHPQYEPSWLKYAVPYEADIPVKCKKYEHFNSTVVPICNSSEFDTSRIKTCSSFVFKTNETTIVNDFDLYCDDNLWKLTLVGTINNVGQFVGLPISGFLSDKFGRRTVLILGMVFCALAGLAKTFGNTYTSFLVWEFIDAAFESGVYSCGFILGVELVGPSKRVLVGSIISCCYAIGEIITASVAWLVQSWRTLTLIIYLPSFLLLSYFWITPESVRWLLAKGKYQQATDLLRKAAKVNRKNVSEESLQKLTTQEKNEVNFIKYPFFEVFKSVPLLLRFINCCFSWISCAFLFYGLTLNSVALAGNSYFDFIVTAACEIPGYFITYMLLDRIGRKFSLCGSFLLTGIACFIFIFVSKDIYWLQLLVYLTGKFGATIAFTVCYVISSEIFPTPLRHSVMGICSMIGRIGSMLAPQMPLLEKIWTPFPLVLFSAMATIAAILSLFYPETLNTKLPDTIEEAENIGEIKESK